MKFNIDTRTWSVDDIHIHAGTVADVDINIVGREFPLELDNASFGLVWRGGEQRFPGNGNLIGAGGEYVTSFRLEGHRGETTPVEIWYEDAEGRVGDEFTLSFAGPSKQEIVDRLWQAADYYQSVECGFDANGVAAVVGYRLFAALEGKPHTRADAVVEWWQGIWNDFEVRMATVLNGGEADYDFSCHGERPYRVAEVVGEGSIQEGS